jgi:hypothetical protein
VVWFRKTVELSAGGAGRLELGAIDDMDVTWVNGKRVGGYEVPGHHYTLRNYTVPEGLLKPGKNVIAVRVMDHGSPGGIAGNAANMKLTVGSKVLPLAGEWRYRAGADLQTLISAVFKTEGEAALPADRGESFKNGFALADNDVVVVMGGTNALKQQDHGYFETLLMRAAKGKAVYFRNMAWQADTVYRQQRPRSFGSHLSHLQRVDASIVIAAFGQMEAMDGQGRIAEFIAAYEKLLDEIAVQTKKIVLVTPFPFQKPDDPHIPDLTRYNKALVAYATAIKALAAKRGYLCADLSRPSGASDATTDGIQLTAIGQWRNANRLAGELLGPQASKGVGVTGDGEFSDSGLEKVRQAILAKNELWTRHWRPSNWGFLYGNRQTQPSSHNHHGGGRWFPTEINGILTMVEKAEDEIVIANEQMAEGR